MQKREEKTRKREIRKADDAENAQKENSEVAYEGEASRRCNDGSGRGWRWEVAGPMRCQEIDGK